MILSYRVSDEIIMMSKNKENSFYSREELLRLGIKSVGDNVYISRKSSMYGCSEISIGSNVRIDDFCVLSGKITLGNYIHIAVYCALFGGETGIEIKDFCGLSSRCSIYAESDDYSGKYLTNPTVPKEYLGIVKGKVVLNKHVIIGSGSVVLPGSELGEGVAVGCISSVHKSLPEWNIYFGSPCKKIKTRSKELLDLEKKLNFSGGGVTICFNYKKYFVCGATL